MRRRIGLSLMLVSALVLVACNGAEDEPDTTAQEEAGAGEVVMANISFQPDELTVPVGATVTWTNEDGVSHTTTSEETVWDSDTMTSGDTFSFTFDEAGTYAYFCEIHPGQMRATITVEG